MEQLHTTFKNKLFRLFHSLKGVNREFEIVSDEVENVNLKSALNSLSMESCHYVDELYAQLLTHGLGEEIKSAYQADPSVPAEALATADEETGNELSRLCLQSEEQITNAYLDIFSESFPFPCLREMMQYQMNSLKCAFMKIKLVLSSRNEYVPGLE